MARFTGGGSGSGSGAPGPRGPQGDSAYEVAVDNGFVGTEQEWLDSLGGDGTGADIADFIFTAEEGQSVISLPGDRQMRIQAGADSDLYITAGDDLYIQTLGEGDDIHLNAADDIRFTTNSQNAEFETVASWSMNSEGEFHLPGPGYISNPSATVVTPGTRTGTYTDNYLNDQSGINDTAAVLLPVDTDSAWFADYANQALFNSPAIITFADNSTVSLIAIYDATSQGTPAVIAQWNTNITKTFAEAYPLTISANYTTTTYDGSPTIVLDPGNFNNDQKLVVDITAPNHVHLRAGGAIDQSTAELILGGERNKVAVSDSSKSIAITTAATIENTFVNANEVNNADLMVPDTSNILIGDNIVMFGISYPVTYFSPDPNNTGFSIVRATGATFVAGDSYTFVREEPYDNYWQFTSTGVFSGPAMGGVKVPAISNSAEGNDLYVYANEADVNIQANDGAVTIDASEINITSNAVPAFLNINTYGGAVVNSNRTSTYADANKIVATLGDRAYVRVSPPTTSIGQEGDVFGRVAEDGTNHYFCTGTYDGDTHIWKRIAWSADTWGV